MEGESNLVMDEGDAFYFADDVAQLRLVGFEELPACRDVEEQVLDHEVTAFGAHVNFLPHHLRRL